MQLNCLNLSEKEQKKKKFLFTKDLSNNLKKSRNILILICPSLLANFSLIKCKVMPVLVPSSDTVNASIVNYNS